MVKRRCQELRVTKSPLHTFRRLTGFVQEPLEYRAVGSHPFDRLEGDGLCVSPVHEQPRSVECTPGPAAFRKGRMSGPDASVYMNPSRCSKTEFPCRVLPAGSGLHKAPTCSGDPTTLSPAEDRTVRARADEMAEGVNGPAVALGIVELDCAAFVEPVPAIGLALAEGLVGELLQVLNACHASMMPQSGAASAASINHMSGRPGHRLPPLNGLELLLLDPGPALPGLHCQPDQGTHRRPRHPHPASARAVNRCSFRPAPRQHRASGFRIFGL